MPMFALFPPGTKDFQVCTINCDICTINYDPLNHLYNQVALRASIIHAFDGMLPGQPGLRVYDAHLEKWCLKWFDPCALMVNDTQGIAPTVHGKKPGSIVGACPLCELLGRQYSGRRVYPGAVGHLPCQHQLRREYVKEFAGYPAIAALGETVPPLRRTHQGALEAGKLYNYL